MNELRETDSIEGIITSSGKIVASMISQKGAKGNDGRDGIDGLDGRDLEFDWNGTQLGVRKEGDSEYVYVNLKGDKGDIGAVGQNGTDGISPTIDVSKIGKVTTITITDAEGIHTATINDGADGSGTGDMLKETYDINGNGIVDNSEKVNNHIVESDVPSNAVFTDTTYTAGTGIDITDGVISNTQTSAEWGNITGTLNNQTDLQNALNNKANTNDIPTATSDLINDIGFISEIPSTYKTKSENDLLYQEKGNYALISDIPIKTSELTNDSNFIVDNNYIHTDNNFTSAEKQKLSNLCLYTAGTGINIDGNIISVSSDIGSGSYWADDF